MFHVLVFINKILSQLLIINLLVSLFETTIYYIHKIHVIIFFIAALLLYK